MSGQNNGISAILGSTTAVVGGVAGVTVLPETGHSSIGMLLAAVSVVCGLLILSSAIVRRVLTHKN